MSGVTVKAGRKAEYSRAPWAVYLKHDTHKSPCNCVLLTDGAFTDHGNCFMREYGHVWHKPKYFSTRRAAIDYVAKYFGMQNRYTVCRYTGPTEPWERAA